MTQLITNEIRQYIKSRPWPSLNGQRPKIEVMQNDYVGDEFFPHVEFIMYRDNFNMFDGEQQMMIAGIMQEIHKKLRDSGIPTTLEVKAGVGE